MIKPVNTITEDVAQELKSISKKFSVPISKLYVVIHSIHTFIKTGKSGFEEMSDKDLDKYCQEQYLRDANIEIKQEYDVEILSHYKEYPFTFMKCEIELEENDSLAYLVIKKGSRLNYYDGLHDGFLDYIDELKLRSNVMFYLFDTDYENSINQLVEILKKTKTITFKDDKKVLIAKGFNEIKSIKAEVYMTIEENYSDDVDDKHKKVDHANRGFLLSCSEGDKLFEFIKPEQGEHGRDVKGNIIKVDTVDLSETPTFTVEDSIEVNDSFENIKYLSKKSGYLVKDGDQYKVSNSIDLDEISFKTTGTIDSDLDTEISINVIKSNPLEDAIEEGMHVKVQKISINGSIGPKTKIEARFVSIEGQTHDSSSIQCVNANIGLHKGKIVGRDIDVKTLEGGEVIADNASITNAMSGKVSAQSINIGMLGSRVILRAGESINIEKIRGEENTLIIDDSFGSSFDDKKDDDHEYAQKTKDELCELEKLFRASSEKLKNNLDSCNKITKLIIKAKEDGLKISEKMIKNFKACKFLKINYKNTKEKFEYKKAQYDTVKKKLSESEKAIFEKQIRVQEPLTGFNTIIYKLSKKDIEVKLKVNEFMTKKVFKLDIDDDGAYRIINTD